VRLSPPRAVDRLTEIHDQVRVENPVRAELPGLRSLWRVEADDRGSPRGLVIRFGQHRAHPLDRLAVLAVQFAVVHVERQAGEVVEPERGRHTRVAQGFAPFSRCLRTGDVTAYEQGIRPEQLTRPAGELSDVKVEELGAPAQSGTGATLTMMAEVLEVPQHKPAVTQKPVDVSEQRLRGVHPVELHFRLHRDHALEHAGRASEHVELRALRVELDQVDPADALPGAPVVERNELDLLRDQPWVEIVAHALGREAGTATLHVTREPACSSIYEPLDDIVDRHPRLEPQRLADRRRAVNERLLFDGCEAMARAGGLPGEPSSQTIGLWMSFIATPTARTWYRAHNVSIVSAYLEKRYLAELESKPERFFPRVVSTDRMSR
jgi:hypothetical protein